MAISQRELIKGNELMISSLVRLLPDKVLRTFEIGYSVHILLLTLHYLVLNKPL